MVSLLHFHSPRGVGRDIRCAGGAPGAGGWSHQRPNETPGADHFRAATAIWRPWNPPFFCRWARCGAGGAWVGVAVEFAGTEYMEVGRGEDRTVSEWI